MSGRCRWPGDEQNRLSLMISADQYPRMTFLLAKILLHHFPDIPTTPMQDGMSRIECHSDRRLDLHEWRHEAALD
jgi:hypothetical protein